jgi:3-oxoadipate enol-lactonase
VRLAYDDAGSGPCVVLIHGHPFNRSLWQPQVAALEEDFRVVAPDLRGFGESPVTPGTVTMREYAADVEGLLADLAINTAAVVGLSMGGLVAMELTVTRPERYWAVGLIATTAEPPGAEDGAIRRQRADLTERDGMRRASVFPSWSAQAPPTRGLTRRSPRTSSPASAIPSSC